MKRIILFLLLISLSFSALGCMFENKDAASVNTEAETVDEIKDSEEQKTFPSSQEFLQRLEAGESVMISDIAPRNKMTLGYWNGRDVYMTFDSTAAIMNYHAQQILESMARSSSYYSTVTRRLLIISKTEDDNYYALAALPDNKSDEFFDTLDDETKHSPAEDAEVFAFVEKGCNTINELNPSVTENDVVESSVTLVEAAEYLKAGKTVRVCDIAFPDSTVYVSSMLTDESGNPKKTGKSRVILDNLTKEDYKKSFTENNELTGARLSLEILTKWEENGAENELLMYAYLPVEYLDDAVLLNMQPEKYEKDFLNTFGDKAVVFFIKVTKYSRVLYNDDSKIPPLPEPILPAVITLSASQGE